MNKNKKVILILFLCVMTVGLLFGTVRPSSVHDFPVPFHAEIKEVHSENSYTYKHMGINRLYLFQARLWGWKKVDGMGSLQVFEKDGKRVDVITFQDGFDIGASVDE
ncbi:hypothetical protein [Alteribacter aurantiacus]|uniref:hypothetical protein n=1 Tax=Alteribacter aurantiacus TaxID=254410 RepID=UPI000421A77D|nr:hypothetical protein [Alteribacter aurantiacus]